jgi:alpha-ketoglutarate-dependent taurine dioxygenase
MAEVIAAASIRLNPLTPGFGAVVDGVEPRAGLTPDEVAALRGALLRYKVLFFRGLSLGDREQQAFADHFGPPFAYHGRYDVDDDEPGLSSVTVVPHFHSDYMYMKQGPAFSMLQMLTVPESGGDTLWADLVTSYEELSLELRGLLERLTAVHVHPSHAQDDETLLASRRRRFGPDFSRAELALVRDALQPSEHPLVRLIPETGRANYWVSARHTQAIKGMSRLESDALLRLLFEHQLQPRFIVRWKWQPGDIAFWDHRTTLHSGVRDYGSAKRFGRRASIAANSPRPTAAYPG